MELFSDDDPDDVKMDHDDLFSHDYSTTYIITVLTQPSDDCKYILTSALLTREVDNKPNGAGSHNLSFLQNHLTSNQRSPRHTTTTTIFHFHTRA